ncbi:MAG: DEAD/DEAH box helicase, partial [Bacteroides sp.]|nr:DEAD/DEAH box helicase [Bacteroides sp.]
MNKINDFLGSALQNLKIEELNPMQESLLRSFTSKKDIVLLSPTGTGKTLAYLLPLMESLDPANPAIQALILVPSRELALQIESVFKQINSPLKIYSCYGGHSIADEKKSIAGNHPAVIVGTPGRIKDHLGKDNFNASTVRYLILDEFDKSLELGFQEEMQFILSYLSGLTQRILLSATDAEQIPDFTGVGEALRLNFLENDPEESRLQLMKVLSPEKDKLRTLFRLLCSLGSRSAIVFANHRDAAERISGYLP